MLEDLGYRKQDGSNRKSLDPQTLGRFRVSRHGELLKSGLRGRTRNALGG